MKMKHIFGLFAMMVMLVLSSCQKLDDLEPGSDALLPTRAVYSGDEMEGDTERPSLKDKTRSGEDIESDDDDVDNVNDDDDEEEDDEVQSLNGLPQ